MVFTMFPIHWIRWQNIVDFVVLSIAFYLVLLWAKQTRVLRFALMIVGFHIAALWAWHFDLTITSWVLEGASLAVIGLLVLLFQSELRHSLLRLDSIVRLRFHAPAVSDKACDAIVAALFAMAHLKIGALIVLAGKDRVGDLVSSGTRIDAEVSKELLEAIFRKESPLHDGAVIVEGERISSAGVVLPLTERDDIPSEFGTRHRAAIGMAENCDALVLVASEERGEVVAMEGGSFRVMPDELALRNALRNLRPKRPASLWTNIRDLLFTNLRYRIAATALASLIWGTSFFGGGTAVKNVAADVEFGNVPAGLSISNQTAGSVSVQLRGSGWVMDTVMPSLTAHVNLSGFREGYHTVRLGPEDLKLPPGVDVERISPPAISIRLTRKTAP